MTSTSCSQIAHDLLERCLAGNPPETLPPALLEEPCGKALFGIWVEGLADRFEPALCDIYARLFAGAVGGPKTGELLRRYEEVRRPRPIQGEPRRIVVLSRVTLGADVAVTSVLLAAARQRFPRAELVFAGPRKNFELFAGGAIRHAPLEYQRAGLGERLRAANELQTVLADGDVVIDPDSRLTQLGLLPVGSANRYHLFESRAYGGDSDRALPELAAAWAAETFGIDGARPFVTIPRIPGGHVAISFGVGGNLAKRIPDPFEEDLLRNLGGRSIWIDKGAGGEEAERVERAITRSGSPARRWEGSFAGFAEWIAGARVYVGYDSAGQHVAAACGVPLICIFAGFPSLRMFQRWRPVGPTCHVIRADSPDPALILNELTSSWVYSTFMG